MTGNVLTFTQVTAPYVNIQVSFNITLSNISNLTALTGIQVNANSTYLLIT